MVTKLLNEQCETGPTFRSDLDPLPTLHGPGHAPLM